MNDDNCDDLKAMVEAEFRAAVGVARTALAEFNREPLVPSKRGGPRRNPAFVCWREASSIALRWHALLPSEANETAEYELDRILRRDSFSP